MGAVDAHRLGADEMRKEYDFASGVRGKYAKRFARSSNVVVLDPDVAKRFKTSKAVNNALRGHLEKKSPRRTRRRPVHRRG
jgi:hypothetical protein